MKTSKRAAEGHRDVKVLRRRIEELESACKELERAATAIRSGEERFRSLVEATSDWIWEVDADAVYTYVSPKVTDILGYEPEEVLGKTPFDLTPPEEAKRMASEFDTIRKGGEPFFALENLNLCKDGQTVVLETSGVPVFDSDGKLCGYRGIDRDVTGRKHAEEALRRSKERERLFHRQLTVLHEVTNALSMADSFDELCRHAVELGQARLGFDRLGLWFATDEPFVFVGSFGIDEKGRLRDERGKRVTAAQGPLMDRILAREVSLEIRTDVPLYDDHGTLVGRGTHVVASLWDGKEVLGYVTVDNLIGQEEIAADQCELLRLYASSLGHLCTRKRFEEALRAGEVAERCFREHLTALHEVTNELSKAESLDDLCRQAVELGRSELGFDRMSLWFVADEPNTVVGSFGVDEEGNLRDERNLRIDVVPGSVIDNILTKRKPLAVDADIPSAGVERRIVGRATVAIDALWDGKDVIGYISADNLLRRNPITEDRRKLLGLYASAIGHLYSRLRADQALREGEEQMRLILEHSTDAIHITEVKREVGRQLVMCNDRYVEMAGRSREELMAARDLNRFIAGSASPEEMRANWAKLEQGVPCSGRDSWIRPDGQENHYEWTAAPIERDGQMFIIGIDRDITQRVQAHEALRRSEERERLFREQLTVLHEVTNELAMAESFNELCRQAVELGRDRLGFERLSMWFTTDDPQRVAGSFGVDEQGNLRDERDIRIDLVGESPVREVLAKTTSLVIEPDMPKLGLEGEVVGRADTVHAALWDGEDVIGYLAVDNFFSHEPFSEDRCELQRLYASALGHLCSRKRAEEMVRAAHRRLLSAREEERKRLAGELHDSVGQGLVALQMTLRASQAKAEAPPSAEAAERTRAQCDALVREVRYICQGLYPTTLEPMGLEMALQQLARDFQSEAEVVIKLSPEFRGRRLAGDVEIAVFRIAQEAVSNAVRHGRAERVEVDLSCSADEILVEVVDNGPGFDQELARGKGLGLTIMKERARAVGGELRIEPEPGRTAISARIPAGQIMPADSEQA